MALVDHVIWLCQHVSDACAGSAGHLRPTFVVVNGCLGHFLAAVVVTASTNITGGPPACYIFATFMTCVTAASSSVWLGDDTITTLVVIVIVKRWQLNDVSVGTSTVGVWLQFQCYAGWGSTGMGISVW